MAKSKPDNPPQVAVAILDTHCLVREALGHWLEQQEGYRVGWKGGSYAELEAAMEAGLEVGLVLVAVSVGEEMAFRTLEQLRAEWPGLGLLAFVHRHDDATVLRVFRCGAQGLLHDAVQPEAALCALNAARVGGLYHSVASQHLLLQNPDGLTQAERDRMELRKRISRREWEVLVASIQYPGYTSARLAKLLKVAPRTMTTYFTTLFEIFKVRSRPALMGVVQKMGLMDAGGLGLWIGSVAHTLYI